jgi:hypothetical protein
MSLAVKLRLSVASLLVCYAALQAAPEDKPKTKANAPAAPGEVNDLSMEVAALRTLYLLQPNANQMKNFRELGKDCAQKPRKRFTADVSDRHRKLLTELRDALLKDDEDRIVELSEQLEELRKDEDPDLDDAVDISDEARKQAPRMLASLNANYVVHYLSGYGKDFPTPYGMIKKAMRLDNKGKPPSPEDWKEQRDFTAREVGWAIGGLDAAKAKKKTQEVAQFLDRVNALSPEEREKQRPELEKELRKLAAAHAMDVLRNVIERDLAELLSNPRYLAAMDARMAQKASK